MITETSRPINGTGPELNDELNWYGLLNKSLFKFIIYIIIYYTMQKSFFHFIHQFLMRTNLTAR